MQLIKKNFFPNTVFEYVTIKFIKKRYGIFKKKSIFFALDCVIFI